jgi:hypothetical protein
LQGIWTDEFDTPLQRPAKYANQEFFTEAQRAELDRERAALIDRDKRGERGTEADVSQAYNFAVFLSTKHAGARTSLIVDPSNGRIPPLTPEASEGRRRGSGISTRPFASDRNVQGQGGRM